LKNSKKLTILLASSLYSSCNVVVNSLENKARIGFTFCLLKLLIWATLRDILTLLISLSLFVWYSIFVYLEVYLPASRICPLDRIGFRHWK